MPADDHPGPLSVSVENMGGIDDHAVTFEPGVTVLTGRNATNRTSLLRSVAAGLGGSAGELKSDADAGTVELSLGDDAYTRAFERRGEDVAVTGDPYTDDDALVDQFSCLLETNPARRAVERGDGDALRDVIMAPVDTDAIAARIDERQRELRETRDRIDEIERRRSNLAALKERRRETEDELAAVESELADLRDAVDEYEADADAAEEAEAVVEELTDVRAEYETVRDRLATQRNAVDSLEGEREETAARLDEVSVPEAELESVESEIERLQRRERELENTVNDLLSIVEFNEELVESSSGGIGGDDGAVVDELDPMAGTVECWTCGTEIERGDVAERLEDLRELVVEKRRERDAVREDIAAAREERAELREGVDERAELEARLADVDDEIAERESRIADLEEREASLRERIQELEAEAADSEGLRDSELLDRYQRLSELEYERGKLEEQRDSLAEEIATVEALADEQAALEAEAESLREELTDLRNRIEDLERTAIETFNEHVATVLARLDYDNVERVWIERTAGERADRGTPEGTFDLHVVRSGDDGAVYEDTVDHLSESEREVIGLVVALAGYLVHDVHEHVPVMLLDSLEAIDSDRIAALVEYFADYAPFLLVALLPEDARALPDRYDRVAMGEAVA